MRIIAGKHRGRAIRVPRVEGLRPTADRVRESLFDILTHGLDLADAESPLGAEAISAISLRPASRAERKLYDKT